MPGADAWTQVPTGLLDLGQKADDAAAWAAGQRAQLAETWAQVQRQAVQTMADTWQKGTDSLDHFQSGYQNAPDAPTGPTGPAGYNDMAGASSGGSPAFGVNPQDATSPIDQARDQGTAPQLLGGPTPLTDIGNQIVQGQRDRMAAQDYRVTPTLGTRADQPAREQVYPTIPGKFDMRAGYTPSQIAAQQSSAENIAMGSTGIEKVGPDAASTRFFHGTGSSFGVPDAAHFDPNGLFGPGYYLTSDARVAGSYAEKGQPVGAQAALQAKADAIRAKGGPNADYMAKTIESQIQKTAPQTRAVNVPNGLNLLDMEKTAPPQLIQDISSQVGNDGRGLSQVDYRAQLGQSIPASDLWNALSRDVGPGKANQVLQQAGYDGIRYSGGKRIPMTDAAGAPIEHTAVVIFPASLGKLTNAISGTRFGSPPAVGGAVLGGVAGGLAPANSDQERAQHIAVGAGVGALSAYGLQKFGESGNLARLASEDTGAITPGNLAKPAKSAIAAINELIAPAKNTSQEVQTALRDFANRRLEGPVRAESAGLEAKNVLGPLDRGAAAENFEATSQIHPNQTPEQAAFASKVDQYMGATNALGKAHGYINGDVTAGPNAQVSSYFPHIYEENLNPASTAARKAGLNPRDFYSNSRTYATLADARAAGLTPVDSFSGPYQHYVGHVQDSEAKYQLVQDLLSTKKGQPPVAMSYTPGTRLPDGWVPGDRIDRQFAPKPIALPNPNNSTAMGQVAFTPGTAFAPEVAAALKNILNPSAMRSGSIGRGLLNAQSLGKELLFSLSGFHNVTELRQAINANGIKGVPIIGRTLANGFLPGAWSHFRLNEADGMAQAARSGVTGLAGSEKALDVPTSTLSPVAQMALRSGAGAAAGASSGYGIASASGADDQTRLRYALLGALGGAAAGPLMKPIADSLWERQVPTLKYLTWKTQVAAGRDPEAAASFVNNTFGGQNLAAIARSKTVQDTLRTVMLAPDWWESWAKQVKNVAAGGDKGAMARQYWARTAIINAFTLEGLNYAFNHHFTNTNDPDHANQLEVTGLYKQLGVDRRDPKTGAPIREYMSVLPGPVESLLNLTTGGTSGAVKFVKGRLSTPVRAAVGQISNTNYRGQPIVPPYTPSLEEAKLRGADLLSQVSPIGVQQAETSAAGSEPASVAAFAAATGLRTSAAGKSTYAGPQISQGALSSLRNAGVDWQPSPVGDAIKNFALSRDERTQYQASVDQATEAIIPKLIANESFQKLGPVEKKAMLDKIVGTIRQNVGDKLLASIPRDELKKRLTVERSYQTAGATP